MPASPSAATASGIWSKTKTGSKAGFDKVWGWADKLGAPVNRLSNRLGSEAFWPTTLDKESDKAARILKSFCKDGFYAEEKADRRQSEGAPQGKQRVLKKIPTEVIQNAKGLAIFTTMRTGLWVSGAGGSGVLVGRLPDGSWSPPSGILLHTAGLGFLVGVDIYDCVVVINTYEALEAFTKIRCTLGGEVSAVAGPVGMGGVLESEVHKRHAPIFTYLKSRGFYAGVQVDGTVIIERTDENERFYGQKIPVGDIMKGKVRHPPFETRALMETIKAAEGYSVDETLLPSEAPPGDYELDEPTHLFGIPDKEDPDPFGFVALQQQGLDIREAGSKARANADDFDFKPSPTSPVHTMYSSNIHRRSTDSRDFSMQGSRRSSWRASAMSTASRMTDSATQTDVDELEQKSPQRSPFNTSFPPEIHHFRQSSRSPGSSNGTKSMEGIPEQLEIETGQRETASKAVGPPPMLPPRLPPRIQNLVSSPPLSADETDGADADGEDEDDIVVHKVQTATAPQRVSSGSITLVSKPRLVTVHKPTAPKLPPRNPGRDRRKLDVDGAPISPISPTSSAGATHDRRTDEGSEASSRKTRAESMSSISEAKGSPEMKDDKEMVNGLQDVDLVVGDAPKDEKEMVSGLQAIDLASDAPKDQKEAISELQVADLVIEAPKDDKADAASFHEVDLHKLSPTEETKRDSAEPRLSGQMSDFRNSLKVDDDDDEFEDAKLVQKAPGAW